MAAGDLTASSPVLCTTSGAMVAAIDALNLAAATDMLMVVPANHLDNAWWVFKVLRAAS